MASTWTEDDRRQMRLALALAARGEGSVEPNPLVGCVVVRDGSLVGQGWHQRFGGPHAEIEALRAAGDAARGGTMYVTLEPCCHFGQTPPCTEAVVAAGVRRVVVAESDPFPLVNGGGIDRLRQAGVEVDVGLLDDEARWLNAPFHKLVTTQRPWVIAKWAMSLDGKIATSTGDSQWITGERSRAVVHRLRGRVDAILVGRGTVLADNPRLTARPPGPRAACRIVLASRGDLPDDSLLLQSAREAPLLVVAGPEIPAERRARLAAAGCELLVAEGATWQQRWPQLLDELGRRRMTNLLVEGGAKTLGGLFDLQLVDEVHAFISPRVIGGVEAPGPAGGTGAERLADSFRLSRAHWEFLDGDLYCWGRRAAAGSRAT